MAVTTSWYGAGASQVLNAAVDWDTDAINVSLHTSTYTPNQDTDAFFSAASNELSTASGYTAGGVALTTKTRTYDAASNEVRLDADDVTWTFSASKTFRYAVFRKARGGAASADELIGWTDWGTDQTVTGVYTIQWDPAGIFYATVA